jgi:hypothetical protein
MFKFVVKVFADGDNTCMLADVGEFIYRSVNHLLHLLTKGGISFSSSKMYECIQECKCDGEWGVKSG